MNEHETTQEQPKSEMQPEEQSEAPAQEEVKAQAKSNQIKGRLISMLVLAISLGVAGSVLIALIIGQTIFGIFTKEPNDSMKALAKQLTDYVYKTLQYLSFNSEERHFPYQPWDEEKETIVRSENVEQSA